MDIHNKPAVIAHRGASGYAPENTLAAFNKAVNMGADAVELDVQLTLDEQVVVIHDPTLDRTTDFTGNVCDFYLKDLQKADAGFWFSGEFRNEKIPTLQEVLDAVRGRLQLNIEIKDTEEHLTIVENVIRILKDNEFDHVFISSFSKEIIELVKEKNASLKTGYLFEFKLLKHVFEGDWEYLCASHTLVNEEFVRKARDAGKEVFAWTVNKPHEMDRMIGLGVDGIITNYPDILKKMLRQA
ncbi:glycerophosphodiester phosphodiesterase [candidate division KSB1 bacterium]|nr:glycerophosphodiester phosphodiesterase [candidate division KSB1 bacterium]